MCTKISFAHTCKLQVIVYCITGTPYVQAGEKHFTESGNPEQGKQLINTRFLCCGNCYVKVTAVTDLAKFSGDMVRTYQESPEQGAS